MHPAISYFTSQLREMISRFRAVILFFVFINLLQLVLPQAACQFVSHSFPFLATIISLCYALTFLLPFYALTQICRVDARTEPWNPWLRVLISLLLFDLFLLVIWLNGLAGTQLMKKFATDTSSYFELTIRQLGAGYHFILAVTAPLLYLFLQTGSYVRRKSGSLETSLLTVIVLMGILSRLCQPTLIQTGLILILTAALFWKCGDMLKKLYAAKNNTDKKQSR